MSASATELVQGSPEWLAIRVGKVTASRMADLCARTKSGFGASRANYMAELIAERLTGQPAERYVNAAMQWGIDHEADAAAAYEYIFDAETTKVGFVDHPLIAMSGASPDRLVNTDGLLEVKCPNTATHLDYLIAGEIPDKYVKQMQWQMACTGRAWCDFVSYDPRLPENLRVFSSRVSRDSAAIIEMERAVREFIRELDDKLVKLSAVAIKKAA